jgi:3-oxoacyl-[acyl-carrier protein] reductase
MDSSDLQGRVALITGASRGIGSAIATMLASAGVRVAINYREREADAREVVSRLCRQGHTALALRADVSVGAEVDALHQAVRSAFGAIDILVNNAGRGTKRSLDELDEAEFDRTIAVNLKSAFLCSQAVIPDMRSRRWGRIVNVSSVAARTGGALGVHYNASKAGLEGLTRSGCYTNITSPSSTWGTRITTNSPTMAAPFSRRHDPQARSRKDASGSRS